jgi:hypothetical protein
MGNKAFGCFTVFISLLWLAFVSGIIYVAVHFIGKFW